MTMKLYTTAKAIDVAIAAFHTSGQTLQAEAHTIAVSVLQHVGKNHDVRVVLKFINAMPEMGRANALRDWFAEFGPVAFDGSACTHVAGKATRVGDAIKMPFWKFSPEADYVPVNPGKALEALIKKLETDGKKTGRNWSKLMLALKTISVEPGTPAPQSEGDKATRRTAIRAAKDAKPLPVKAKQAKARKPKAVLAVTAEANLH